MTTETSYFEKLRSVSVVYPQVAQDLAAKGWQVVWATLNEDGEWSPLVGCTGSARFPSNLAQPPGDVRIALRPPEDVIVLDVDHYSHKLGMHTIERAEEALGMTLPGTWRLSSRGADNPSGRYLCRIPSGNDTRHWERALKFFGDERVSDVEIVRTGHRFSWGPLDVNPKIGELVQVYGPNGEPAAMP